MTQFDLVGSMVSALDMAGIDHMVAGSFASTFRGEPRMTQDIDLVIDPDEDSLRRTITRAQRNALIVRDGGRVFPGCDRPPSWCDGHHVIHWLNHGPSELWNLTLLCSAHHRAVHVGGWQLTHADRRTPATDRLVFTDPTGRRMPPDPPAARHRRQQAHQAPVPDPTPGAHRHALTDRPQVIQRC